MPARGEDAEGLEIAPAARGADCQHRPKDTRAEEEPRAEDNAPILLRMNPLDFIACSLAVYAVTLVIAQSHAMKAARGIFRELTWEFLPQGLAKKFVKWEDHEWDADNYPRVIAEDNDDLDLTIEREIHGYDFISCRLCVGFWVTIALCVWFTPPAYLLAIYGASHFLTTQER